MTQIVAKEDYSKELAQIRQRLRSEHPQKGIFWGTFSFIFGANFGARLLLNIPIYMCKSKTINF